MRNELLYSLTNSLIHDVMSCAGISVHFIAQFLLVHLNMSKFQFPGKSLGCCLLCSANIVKIMCVVILVYVEIFCLWLDLTKVSNFVVQND